MSRPPSSLSRLRLNRAIRANHRPAVTGARLTRHMCPCTCTVSTKDPSPSVMRPATGSAKVPRTQPVSRSRGACAEPAPRDHAKLPYQRAQAIDGLSLMCSLPRPGDRAVSHPTSRIGSFYGDVFYLARPFRSFATKCFWRSTGLFSSNRRIASSLPSFSGTRGPLHSPRRWPQYPRRGLSSPGSSRTPDWSARSSFAAYL